MDYLLTTSVGLTGVEGRVGEGRQRQAHVPQEEHQRDTDQREVCVQKRVAERKVIKFLILFEKV